MKDKKTKLIMSSQEKVVLKTLVEKEGYRTTREIAEDSGISWQAVHRFLKKLLIVGWINHIKQGKWEYWRVIVK